MKDRKKLSAIVAAVNTYLEEEASSTVAIPKKPPAEISVWHLYGRQQMMQMRALWQRRIVPR